MTNDEIKQSAKETIEQARLAESLINSTAWKDLFEPLLKKKLDYYQNIENCDNLEASKLTVEALKSLKSELEDYINGADEAQKVIKKIK